MFREQILIFGYVAAGNNSLFALSITPAGLWKHGFAGLFLCKLSHVHEWHGEREEKGETLLGACTQRSKTGRRLLL